MAETPPNRTITARDRRRQQPRETEANPIAGDTVAQRAAVPATVALQSALQDAGFTLLAEIGRGGMGAVYKAYDQELDRTVALKLLHRNDDLATEALLAEARAAAKLSHPNVAAVHSVGIAGDRVFMTMEFVEGESLKAWLSDTRDLTEILVVFGQAGRGLAAAHRAGIVHRDFKPHNVMVGRDGRVRVLDFGLARSATSPSDDVSVNASTAAGTPAYMAPEQRSKATITPAADQYAYCASLFQAIVGTRPFQGASIEELNERKRTRSIASRRGKHTMPLWLWRIVRRGLSPAPGNRHSSMEVLAEKLTRGIPRAGPNYALILAAACSALVMIAAALGASRESPIGMVEKAEMATEDMRFASRGPIEARDDIVIVGLDDRTRQTHPETFQSRRGWARLLTAIATHKPKVIGLDVLFSAPESVLPPDVVAAVREGRVAATKRLPEGDSIRLALDLVEIQLSGDSVLARAIARSGNVVLGYAFFLDRGAVPTDLAPLPKNVARWADHGPANDRFNAWAALGSLPAIQRAASGGAAVNVLVGRDGVVRAFPAALQLGRAAYLPMGLALAATFRSTGSPSRDGVGGLRLGQTRLPSYDGMLLLNHIGPRHSFRTISAADILAGTAEAGALHGKAVLVGLTDAARDKVRTPFDRLASGVELHATLLQNILDRRLLRKPSRSTTLLITLIICLVVCISQLALFAARAWLLLMLWIVLSVGYLLSCLHAFEQHDLVLPMALPLGGALLVAAGAGAGHLVAVLRARRTARMY